MSLALGAWAAVWGCGGESGSSPGAAADSAARTAPAEAGSVALEAPEEIRYDIENLGYEIADLEGLLESGAVHPTSPEAADRLSEARSAYETALEAVGQGDTTRAAERLGVAAARVETVKRALGLAEEWGEPFGAESIPVSVPEDVTS